MVKLFLAADQVVERFMLPELAGAARQLVDPPAGESLPPGALLEHRLLIWKRRQHVHVIRHHDEIGQLVTVAIELLQAVVQRSLPARGCFRRHSPWQESRCRSNRSVSSN